MVLARTIRYSGFAARHAGFLTEVDVFTPDELDLETDLPRLLASTGVSDGLWPRLFRSRRAKT